MFGVQDHTEWWAWGSGMEGQLWLGGVLRRGVRRQQRGPVGVGQAESSGERPRACHKSFPFEESQALYLLQPWQGDPISSFACVLKAQRGTETTSEAQQAWVWPLSLAARASGCYLGTES